MKAFNNSLLIALFIVYEFLLIDFAANNFSLTKTWLVVAHSMPVFQTDIEFAVLLGQLPVIVIFFIIRKKALDRVEKEIIAEVKKNSSGESQKQKDK